MSHYRATYRKSKCEVKPKPITMTYEAQSDLEAIGVATKRLPTLNKRYSEDLTLEKVELITYTNVYERNTPSYKRDQTVSGDNIGSQITERLKGGDKMNHPTTTIIVDKNRSDFEPVKLTLNFEGDKNE